MAIICRAGAETSYWRRGDVYVQDYRPHNQIPKCFYGWVEITKEEYEKAELEGPHTSRGEERVSDLFATQNAVLSECGKFRYRLDRRVADTGPVYAFFGVNPSTADAELDDATVRKWRGFVTRWGGSRFIVGNVFAFRATDVRQLATAADPVGRLSNDYIREIVAEADILVPCWGNITKVPREIRSHFRWLSQVLAAAGKPVKTFGLSNDGHPKHPLMLGYDTPLVDWSSRP